MNVQSVYDSCQANLPYDLLRRVHAGPLLAHFEDTFDPTCDTSRFLTICYSIQHYRCPHARRVEGRLTRGVVALSGHCRRVAETRLGHLGAAPRAHDGVAPDVKLFL